MIDPELAGITTEPKEEEKKPTRSRRKATAAAPAVPEAGV
jgi:hypothetical protein